MTKDQFNALSFEKIGKDVAEFVEAVRSNEPIYTPQSEETYIDIYTKIYGYSIKFSPMYRFSRLFLFSVDKYWIRALETNKHWIRTLETGNYCDHIDGFFEYLSLYDEIVFGKRDGNFKVIKNEIANQNKQLLEKFAG